MPIKNWSGAMNQFAILFEGRAPMGHLAQTHLHRILFRPNNPELTERLSALFAKTFGAQNVISYPPAMVGEDFGRFGLEGHQIPTTLFWVGAAEPSRFEESRRTRKALPSLHSPLFAPVPEPTIRTAVKAMTSAVLDLMKR
jgi:metal-dependent amidase/aminoacylase/carboxypeptidase family protein